jgi:hypothetical protein
VERVFGRTVWDYGARFEVSVVSRQGLYGVGTLFTCTLTVMAR